MPNWGNSSLQDEIIKSKIKKLEEEGYIKNLEEIKKLEKELKNDNDDSESKWSGSDSGWGFTH